MERVPEVTLHSRGARRLASRHPWIFSDDVASPGHAAHGDVVRVSDPAGKPLGFAFWSARSKISLRMVAPIGEPPDAAYWTARLDEALARRAGTADWQARRLVFAESDGIPGFIADLYDTHLVVQTTTAATERLSGLLISALRERIRITSVLARNDLSVRRLEGLAREVVQRDGQTPDGLVIEEGRIRYEVDPWHGQKTGAFLDQRENRLAAAAYARGRVLDAFSYHGSFGLHAALRAAEVVAVDSSGDALARGAQNAARNGFTNMTFVQANVFDELRRREGLKERFELILLDPPAFAKNRGDVPAAHRGYKDVNLRALRLLAPGGVLVTSSCSYNIVEEEFEAILRDAAADGGCDVIVLARRGQAQDHPIRLAFPESRYLTCFVLQRAGAAP
jgi:23S rRNA (cytosine1962-C5)-methyltransferase